MDINRHINNSIYEIYSGKLSDRNVNIAYIGDLHILSPNMYSRLACILNALRVYNNFDKIDAICIVGDLLDRADVHPQEEAYNLLKEIGNIAPVFFIKGNHDYFTYQDGIWSATKESNEFYERIQEIFQYIGRKSVTLPNADISIRGFDFEDPVKAQKYYGKSHESFDTFKKLDFSSFTNSDKYTIDLYHSPYNIMTDDGLEVAYGDKTKPKLIVGAHTHRSMLPNKPKLLKGFLTQALDILPGSKTRGLISSHLELFPELSRDYLTINDGKTFGIIIDPVSFHETFYRNNVLHYVSNLFYEPGITFTRIISNPNEELDLERKVSFKKIK